MVVVNHSYSVHETEGIHINFPEYSASYDDSLSEKEVSNSRCQMGLFSEDPSPL